MNKFEFSNLINYLRNRPSEARRLAAVLGKVDPQFDFMSSNTVLTGESPVTSEAPKAPSWMTAHDVGTMVGMSSRWVRDRIKYLPATCVRRSEVRNAYLLNGTVVIEQLMDIKNRSYATNR